MQSVFIVSVGINVCDVLHDGPESIARVGVILIGFEACGAGHRAKN